MKNHLRTASYIADLLDNKFKVLGFRFGIDPILGLIPGGGDLVSLALSSYIVWIGIKAELPKKKIVEMVRNTALDFVVGLVPLLGDAVDFTFKPNLINLEILRQHLEKDVMEGEVVETSTEQHQTE
ncbi:hypothetical protein A3K01_01570 [candidate division WWE3 bacterium RIFOXYD1_FULL_43_17]|uniref:DUF4112 domain-containing protein n=3 Tax=Katanobacteria TaxID=422282 RepID=A0A1F4XFX8_UNCKA|nr:MAG: hypothetical protein UU59_C0012G0002 [candidate division WWE3 bacterium GW2011_GWE1_41_27]KKS59247.1 MAG: hypothetical protein UV26_C0026G0002 [candidate division WWE3 bacterium GW2011_GWF2_42_42]OGC80506.1 MAG: hypothetical protein A3K01_01570 [candidate division WWE3 bacterium RIFOXYD1_FULL_43_17]